MDTPDFGSKDAASMGGEERAKRLSKEDRQEIARRAAEARWERAGKAPIPQATHEGIARFGAAEIPAANLEDGTRLLSRQQFIKAIGRTGNAQGGRKYDEGLKTPVFLTAANLKPFITMDLTDNWTPILYRTRMGKEAIGYRGELLPMVCKVFLDARLAGALLPNQLHIAEQCRILQEGFASVGVTALIDEATGFQADRARNALAEILEQYINKELRKWVKTFNPSFFEQICRLRKVQFRTDMRLPPYFGDIVNDLVYDRLAPGIREELRRKNPVVPELGRRKYKHFQWLTENIGLPSLTHHLGILEGLARCHTDYAKFKSQVDIVLPKQPEMPLFDPATNEDRAMLKAG